MDDRQLAILTGADKDRLYQAADVLLEARRTLQPIDDLPPALRPKTLEEAYYVQDVMLQALGTVGGWKVGAATPEATPLFAPMPLVGLAASGDSIAKQFRRLRGVEAEIAFLIGKDLPPRSTPYSRDELVDSIASCHPAIELLESALRDPDAADRRRDRGNECGRVCARSQGQKLRGRRSTAPGPLAGQRCPGAYGRIADGSMGDHRELDGQGSGRQRVRRGGSFSSIRRSSRPLRLGRGSLPVCNGRCTFGYAPLRG
jgi:hypothetical protein